MSFEGEKREVEDIQLESALRNFRASVHRWSEQEFGREHRVSLRQPSRFRRAMTNPIAGWALACMVALGAIGVPVQVHHQRQVAALQEAARQQQKKMAEEAARQTAANAIDDEDLLSHVDSDIAQTAPDAMEPLASMMSEIRK